MARARARWAAAVGLALATTLALPSCSVYDQTVLVTGRDEAGTPVVGAVRCDRSEALAADSIDVSQRSYPYEVLWEVGEDWGTGLPAGDTSGAPPPADPGHLGDVRLIAVGDLEPDGYDVLQPLREELPATALDVRAEFGDHPEHDLAFQEAVLDTRGEPGRYDVTSDDRTGRDLDAEDATTVIEGICADDGTRTVRNAVVTGLVATGVVLVGAAVSILAGIRQYRRAGEAYDRRRAGEPPAG